MSLDVTHYLRKIVLARESVKLGGLKASGRLYGRDARFMRALVLVFRYHPVVTNSEQAYGRDASC